MVLGRDDLEESHFKQQEGIQHLRNAKSLVVASFDFDVETPLLDAATMILVALDGVKSVTSGLMSRDRFLTDGASGNSLRSSTDANHFLNLVKSLVQGCRGATSKHEWDGLGIVSPPWFGQVIDRVGVFGKIQLLVVTTRDSNFATKYSFDFLTIRVEQLVKTGENECFGDGRC